MKDRRGQMNSRPRLRRPAMPYRRAISRRAIVTAITAGCCLPLQACAGMLPGEDGQAQITGQIVGEGGRARDGCEVALLHGADQVIGHRTVKSRFRASFTVAPWAEPYRVRISCPETANVFLSDTVTLGGEGANRAGLNLGSVVLKN